MSLATEGLGQVEVDEDHTNYGGDSEESDEREAADELEMEDRLREDGILTRKRGIEAKSVRAMKMLLMAKQMEKIVALCLWETISGATNQDIGPRTSLKVFDSGEKKGDDEPKADAVAEYGADTGIFDPGTEIVSEGEDSEGDEEEVGDNSGDQDEHTAREAVDKGGSYDSGHSEDGKEEGG